MTRKVVALGSAVLLVLLLAAFANTRSVLPREVRAGRTPVVLLPPPLGVAGGTSSAAHEPADVPHAIGRAVSGRSGGFLALTRTESVREIAEAVVDPDADWYAEPREEDANVEPVQVARLALPIRDAGSPDWYDGGRETPSRAKPEATTCEETDAIGQLAIAFAEEREETFESLAASSKVPASFCPLGSMERQGRDERWCARADRSGAPVRHGPVAFLFPNGKTRARGNYVKGTLQGAFVEYAENGRRIAAGSYRDGRKNGSWIFWWDNGNKQSQGSYDADDRQGAWTYFDERGRKVSQGEVRTVDNVQTKEGRWTSWHANGEKASEGTFRDGKKYGPWRTFDENGDSLSLVAWRDGDDAR